MLAAEAVDVVLLDVHVGVGSGLDVLDEIEALELPVARRAALGHERDSTSRCGRASRRPRQAVRARASSSTAVADGASGSLRGA